MKHFNSMEIIIVGSSFPLAREIISLHNMGNIHLIDHTQKVNDQIELNKIQLQKECKLEFASSLKELDQAKDTVYKLDDKPFYHNITNKRRKR